MKQKDVKIGGVYVTTVVGKRVRVRVLREAPAFKWREDRKQHTRFVVQRLDNNKVLPKGRTASALHPDPIARAQAAEADLAAIARTRRPTEDETAAALEAYAAAAAAEKST